MVEQGFKKHQRALEAAIASVKELCGDDTDLLHDMLEGETELFEFAEQMAAQILQDALTAKAVGDRIAQLQARKKRFSDREARLRVLLAKLFDQAEQKSAETPSCTITLKDVQPGVLVTDESEIPSDYWLPQPPKLDRKKLAEDLRNGDDIEGAELGNGSVTISIRTN